MYDATNAEVPFSLPSDEGSGLKYAHTDESLVKYGLPSDEGSGLKYDIFDCLSLCHCVFPRMREVD